MVERLAWLPGWWTDLSPLLRLKRVYRLSAKYREERRDVCLCFRGLWTGKCGQWWWDWRWNVDPCTFVCPAPSVVQVKYYGHDLELWNKDMLGVKPQWFCNGSAIAPIYDCPLQTCCLHTFYQIVKGASHLIGGLSGFRPHTKPGCKRNATRKMDTNFGDTSANGWG